MVRTCGAREHVHVVKQIEIIQDVYALSDVIIAKASTGRSVPTIVIADTQALSARRVLMQGTNV